MTGKFYTLGIMRSLNSRPGLRDSMTSDDIGRTSLSDWQWGDGHENPVARRASEVRVSYKVHVILRLNIIRPRRLSWRQLLHRVFRDYTPCQKVAVRLRCGRSTPSLVVPPPKRLVRSALNRIQVVVVVSY